MKFYRHIICLFSAVMLNSIWIQFCFQNLDPRDWWAFPVMLGGILIIMICGLTVGIWWNDRP